MTFISHQVRRTNEIAELNELFKFIKNYETKKPFLRKVIKNNDAWQETLCLFKIRALQIANDHDNLENKLTNSECYYTILAEDCPRTFFYKNKHLEDFERLLKNKKIFSETEIERYQRTKLIHYLEDYINRIESYRDPEHNINYQHGFWFDKNQRGINRKVNYQLALSLRDKLSNFNYSLEDLFNENTMQEVRNSFDIKPTRNRIGSYELRSIINLGRKLARELGQQYVSIPCNYNG